MKRQVPAYLVAPKPRAQEKRRRQQRAARQRDARRSHANFAPSHSSNDARHAAGSAFDASRLAARDDLGPIASGIHQIRSQGRLLGAQTAAESAVAAIAAATDVARDGPVGEPQLLEAALERGVGPVASAFVGIDIEPRLDRVVVRIEPIDTHPAPLLAYRVRQAQRGAPVHDRSTANSASRQQRNRAVLRRGDAAIEIEGR